MLSKLRSYSGGPPRFGSDCPENCCLRGLLHLQWGYMAFPSYAFAAQITATKF